MRISGSDDTHEPLDLRRVQTQAAPGSLHVARDDGPALSEKGVAAKIPTAASSEYARGTVLNDPRALVLANRLQKQAGTAGAPQRPANLSAEQSRAWDALEKGALWGVHTDFGGGRRTATILHDPSGALDAKGLRALARQPGERDLRPYEYSAEPSYTGADGYRRADMQSLNITGPGTNLTVKRGEPTFDAFRRLYEAAERQAPIVNMRS